MIARQDVPLWGGWPLRAERDLRRIRRQAERHAFDAGREDLLADARQRVARAYAHRLGDMGAWTAIVGVPVPFSARERADSQMVIEDLVTAAVVEDLLPQSEIDSLRADGEHLLGPLRDDHAEAAETGG